MVRRPIYGWTLTISDLFCLLSPILVEHELSLLLLVVSNPRATLHDLLISPISLLLLSAPILHLLHRFVSCEEVLHSNLMLLRNLC